MTNSKSKWFVYTVLVGLIPIASRLLIWTTSKAGTVPAFAPQDFVAFGLVLHITAINELEHVAMIDRSWKTLQNGMAVIFIAVYSVLYSILLLGEKMPGLVEPTPMLTCVAVLAVVSLILGYSVAHRLSILAVRSA